MNKQNSIKEEEEEEEEEALTKVSKSLTCFCTSLRELYLENFSLETI